MFQAFLCSVTLSALPPLIKRTELFYPDKSRGQLALGMVTQGRFRGHSCLHASANEHAALGGKEGGNRPGLMQEGVRSHPLHRGLPAAALEEGEAA